jgi:hypothetical protein
MRPRPDLDPLTPEALAALANLGLVKRAQRELASGAGPALEQTDDGTLIATAPDGAVSRLSPGRSLAQCPCTCGAAGVCRHRIAAVLAFRDRASVVVKPPWELDPATLDAWPARSQIEAALALGLDLTLQAEPPQARLEGVQAAGLAPIATVRFLAGADLAFARCDCGQSRCAHIALAAQGFLSQREGSLRLGAPPAPAAPVALPPVAPLRRLIEETLLRGLTDSSTRAQAREGARLAVQGRVWLEELLTEIEDQQASYEARSARFRPALARQLLTELLCRLKAAAAGGEGRALLGEGEPLEVALPQTRLLSLGARLRPAEGGARELEVLFWDGAGVVEWSERIPAGLNPAEMIAPGVVNSPTLRAIATGQIQSKHLQRDARRSVSLRRGRDTQVYPQRGDWSGVQPPIRVDRLSQLKASGGRLPAFLRPRDRTGAVRVIAVGGVESIGFSPGQQRVTALLRDPEGEPLLLSRSYDGAAPGALAALVAALPQARWVSGWLREERGHLSLEPAGLATEEGVVVPDLAADAPLPALPPAWTPAHSPLDALLGATESWLERLLLDGLLQGPPFAEQAGLEALGLRRFAACAERLHRARAAGDGPAAVTAWTELSARLMLARSADGPA